VTQWPVNNSVCVALLDMVLRTASGGAPYSGPLGVTARDGAGAPLVVTGVSWPLSVPAVPDAAGDFFVTVPPIAAVPGTPGTIHITGGSPAIATWDIPVTFRTRED